MGKFKEIRVEKETYEMLEGEKPEHLTVGEYVDKLALEWAFEYLKEYFK